MNTPSYSHVCCSPAVIRGKHCPCDFTGTPAEGCICLFDSAFCSTCDICYEVCDEFYTLCNIISKRAAIRRQTPSTYAELNRDSDVAVRRATIVNKFLLNLHALAGSEFIEPTKEERAERIEKDSTMMDEFQRIDLISQSFEYDVEDDDATDVEYAMRFTLQEDPEDQDYYDAANVDQDELNREFDIQYNEHLFQLAFKHLTTPPTVDSMTLDTFLPFEPEYYFEPIEDTYA